MIEITENQQSALHYSLWVSDIGIDSGINRFIDSLSADQLKQLCEAKGLSVVEWVEFDMADESTWPSHNESVLIKTAIGCIEAIIFFTEELTAFSADDDNMEIALDDVICWCELPQRKESK